MDSLVFLIISVFIYGVSYSQENNDCILLTDCPAALQHINLRRYDAQSIQLLRSADCSENTKTAKIKCKLISFLTDVPEACVHIEDCPEAMHLINTSRNDPETILTLRKAHCGYRGRQALIYCDKVLKDRNVTKENRLKMDNKINLLPSRAICGRPETLSKIIFGKVAELDDFPWLALIKYRLEKQMEFKCHGSLINPKYVLTAAHCILLNDAFKKTVGEVYSVVLGEYHLRNDPDCVSYKYGKYCALPIQEILIESLIPHSNFNTASGNNDIGLIHLKKEAEYTDFVMPICLPLVPYDLQETKLLIISGWGKTEHNVPSDIKLKARVHMWNEQNCTDRLGRNYINTQICAGSENGSDTCTGDSGGPLMLEKIVNDELRIYAIGITSFGPRGCNVGAGVYTHVHSFMEWILENITA